MSSNGQENPDTLSVSNSNKYAGLFNWGVFEFDKSSGKGHDIKLKALSKMRIEFNPMDVEYETIGLSAVELP